MPQEYVYWSHVKPVLKHEIKGQIKQKTAPAVGKIIGSAPAFNCGGIISLCHYM